MSAAKWKDRGAAYNPVVVVAQVSRLRRIARPRLRQRADPAIIDTPGKSGRGTTEAGASRSSVILIHPQEFDAKTLDAVCDVLCTGDS
jgi:hypothetical protein